MDALPNAAQPQTPVVPAPYAPVQPTVRPPRRIGTFTLGLTLILLGVLVPICLFFGGQTWRLLQFAPVVLLCLGIETLVFAIWHKTEKFRYDGLSVFLVITITFITLAASATVPVATNLAAYAAKQQALSGSVNKTCEDALLDNRLSGYASVYSQNNTADWVYAFQPVDTLPQWDMVATITVERLGEDGIPTKESVADAFTKLARSCRSNTAIGRLQLLYSAEGGSSTTYYAATLSNKGMQTIRAEDMRNLMRESATPLYY